MFESIKGFLENTLHKPPRKLHHLGEVPLDPGLTFFVLFFFFSFLGEWSREQALDSGFCFVIASSLFLVVCPLPFLTYRKNFQGN